MPVNDLDERLNKILEKVTSDDFLGGQGLGNEVPFYAFDYPPQDEIQDRYPPSEYGLLVINGVGSAYPLIRTHNLLNNLQPFMGQTPLVVFYPGLYDGQSLKLFGQLGEKPYYRAFRLVS